MRLKEYDYSWVGWYYVTICTKDGERTLGKIVGEAMVPSRQGQSLKNVGEAFRSIFHRSDWMSMLSCRIIFMALLSSMTPVGV